MITRRSVRIKTMQYIYAFETAISAPISPYQTLLASSILSVKEQYLYLLYTLREVANFVEKDAKIKAGKHLKSDSDKNFNTKLLSNIIIQYLNNDDKFAYELKNTNITELIDEDNIRRLYKKLTSSTEYKTYLNNNSEFNFENDKAILMFLLNNIMLEDEIFTAGLEEHFTNWQDDAEYVVEAVHEVIQKSKNALKFHLGKGPLIGKFQELKQFGYELFMQTINHKKEHQTLIEPKLKNWDSDRLAVLDVIIIRMALTEFLTFPSIPVKVTINEYLDIAKEYSTPKSKDFINGVLDALMKELKTTDQLQKTGRGLI